MGVVFISSELEEVVRLSERIVILKDHRKIGEVVNGPEVSAQSVVSIIAAESEELAEQAAQELASSDSTTTDTTTTDTTNADSASDGRDS